MDSVPGLELRHPNMSMLWGPGSSAQLSVTYLCPIIPMFPDLPLPFAFRYLSLRPSLAFATSSRLPPSPYPCRHQNIFYRDLQLILHFRLSPSFYLELSPSLISCIPCTYVKNRLYVHPLCHYCLSSVQVGLERLCIRSLK